MSIKVENLSYFYNYKTPLEHQALKNINLELESGKMIAIIGSTGSGKTTLVQHFNGLLLSAEGSVNVLGNIINHESKGKALKSIRKEVGLVFQFPEYQLFEESIIKDVAFGPMNFGKSETEAQEIAIKYLKMVGIDESLYERSPLDLSGGQKRRVAIAGILALESQILVLDEPTAGLDPQGAKDMMDLFVSLNKAGRTIIIVTHDLEQVLNHCDEVVVVDNAEIEGHYQVADFFEEIELMEDLKIELPPLIAFKEQLKAQGFKNLEGVLTEDELVKRLVSEVKA